MRPFASALAAVSLLALAGCCWSEGTGACVVETVWGQARCEPFEDPDPVCMSDDGDTPDPAAVASCGGTFRGGEDCPGLGFTQRCEGGHYVRPGSPC